MKLKKIASLALAGVMAVSMLAGCAGKTGTTDDNGNTVVTTGSSAASFFNDEQKETNEVDVTFSYSASLESALTKAVKFVGTDVSEAYVSYFVYNTTGVGNDSFVTKNTADTAADGDTATQLYVLKIDDVWSEDAALKTAVEGLNDEVKDLIDTTFADNQAAGTKYFDFTYTGDVATVAVQKPDGSTVYYVAYTITQSAAEKTFEK